MNNHQIISGGYFFLKKKQKKIADINIVCIFASRNEYNISLVKKIFNQVSLKKFTMVVILNDTI